MGELGGARRGAKMRRCAHRHSAAGGCLLELLVSLARVGVGVGVRARIKVRVRVRARARARAPWMPSSSSCGRPTSPYLTTPPYILAEYRHPLNSLHPLPSCGRSTPPYLTTPPYLLAEDLPEYLDKACLDVPAWVGWAWAEGMERAHHLLPADSLLTNHYSPLTTAHLATDWPTNLLTY